MERIKQEKEEKEKALLQAKQKQQPNKKEQPKINKAKVKKEIALLEEKIAEAEARSEVLSALLADAATYQDEAASKAYVQEYKELEEKIPALYTQWEELEQSLE